MEAQEQQRIPVKNKLMYSLGELYGGGAFLLVGTLYLKFLTDTVLMAGTMAGAILLIGKLWDAVTDPLMGMISDRTESRFGRRKLYFLLGIVPVAVSFALLWVPLAEFSPLYKFLYYLAVQLFFRTSFTLVMVPYSTLMAEMTDSYEDRTRLTGFKTGMSNIGALISGVLPLMIVSGAASPQVGYPLMGLAFGIFYGLPWIVVYFGTWERKNVPSFDHEGESPWRVVFNNLLQCLRNRSFRIQAGLYVCSFVALDTIMALTIYFLTYNLNMAEHFNTVLGVMILAQTGFLPVYVGISNRYGKKVAFILGVSIWAAASLATLLMHPGIPVYLVYLLGFMFGLGASGGTFVPWAMLPEITDVDELMYSERREGVYSGIMTFIRKVAQSLALAVIGVSLDLIGYVPNVAQTPDTLFKLKLMYALIPFTLFVAAISFAVRFPVSPDYHRILMQEIRRRRKQPATQSAQTTDSVLTACEEMTGVPYSGLWLGGED